MNGKISFRGRKDRDEFKFIVRMMVYDCRGGVSPPEMCLCKFGLNNTFLSKILWCFLREGKPLPYGLEFLSEFQTTIYPAIVLYLIFV